MSKIDHFPALRVATTSFKQFQIENMENSAFDRWTVKVKHNYQNC